MLKSIFSVSFVLILATVANLGHAGLEIDNRWGEIVAIYKFDDARDSGPRNFDAHLSKDAEIVKIDKVSSLKLTGKGAFFSCCNDHRLDLLNEFSIVARVRLNPQTNPLNIGMHGITEDGDSSGWANILILPDGNLSGDYTEAATERNIQKRVEFRTHEKNVSDNKWHHIAFTTYDGIYNLFIDGQLAARRHVDEYISFFSDKTNIYITNTNHEGTFNGRILIDDLGFFETGLSLYEIRAIRQFGFDAFLKAMPVEPTGKMATTWGDIKLRSAP